MKYLSFLILGLLVTACDAATLSDETLAVDGVPRRYLVHDFSRASGAPLVILLHGGGGSGENMAQQSGFDTIAEREGLVTVYPYGSSGFFDSILLTWNAGHCCSYAMRQDVDDVRFISLLIDHLVATRKVDPGRVYVTGLSNGGMMAHRLGRELPHKIAAIAPVISSLFGDEPLRELTLPVLVINGADDSTVRVEGGELNIAGIIGASGADRPTLPVARQGEYWAAANACAAHSDTTTALWDQRIYGSCRGGEVQSYLVRNNGHAWPGGTQPRIEADPPVQSVSANELIWDFFKRQRLAASTGPVQIPFYYDGHLTVPAFLAGGRVYTASLALLSGSPVRFDVTRLQETTLPAGGNTYEQGLLNLPRVAVGDSQYRATLSVSASASIRLQLQELTPLPP